MFTMRALDITKGPRGKESGKRVLFSLLMRLGLLTSVSHSKERGFDEYFKHIFRIICLVLRSVAYFSNCL